MVRGEEVGGEKEGPNLGLEGDVQGGDGLQAGGVEDVVQELHLPAALPDLAGGELGVLETVGGLQGEGGGGGQEVQERLLGPGIEVPSEDDGSVLPDGVHPLQQVPPLLGPHHDVEGAGPGLEVGGGDHQPPAGGVVSEAGGQHHLVTGHSPHRQDGALQHNPGQSSLPPLSPLTSTLSQSNLSAL